MTLYIPGTVLDAGDRAVNVSALVEHFNALGRLQQIKYMMVNARIPNMPFLDRASFPIR